MLLHNDFIIYHNKRTTGLEIKQSSQTREQDEGLSAQEILVNVSLKSLDSISYFSYMYKYTIINLLWQWLFVYAYLPVRNTVYSSPNPCFTPQAACFIVSGGIEQMD